jgi:hypothetical protein
VRPAAAARATISGRQVHGRCTFPGYLHRIPPPPLAFGCFPAACVPARLTPPTVGEYHITRPLALPYILHTVLLKVLLHHRAAKSCGASYELVKKTKEMGRLPVRGLAHPAKLPSRDLKHYHTSFIQFHYRYRGLAHPSLKRNMTPSTLYAWGSAGPKEPSKFNPAKLLWRAAV